MLTRYRQENVGANFYWRVLHNMTPVCIIYVTVQVIPNDAYTSKLGQS